MSTKIYNGYKFNKAMSLFDLQNFSMDLRKKITDINKELVPQFFANLCCDYYDSLKLGLKTPEDLQFLFKKYVIQETNLFWGLYFMFNSVCKKSNKTITDILTFDCDVVFIPVSSHKTLALFYSEVSQHKEVFELFDCIEEYCYYNNTDRPEGITGREWKQRGDDWKKALPGIGIPVLNGFSVKCSDDAPSFILGDKIEQRMPSFEDRCNKYSKELAFRERFHESYDLSSGFECCKIIESAKDFLKTPKGLKTIEEKLKLVKTILPEKITISMLKDFKI